MARLLEIAQKLEGLYRHASTHAAGMVIADRPLDELVPLYRDPKSSFPITQYNWKLVEAAGLVKFDFLGLKTLTVLEKAVALIKRGRGIDIDLLNVPLDDRKTYELLAKADTVGVFQLEGAGMRDSLKRLKPDRFEDIIAMVALYRPGPMDNIPTYINRKHGEEPVDCLHPMLEPILKETYGVIIYQEQVMQIAQVMAGFSLGEADLLRRAMGKKDKREMAKQKDRFVQGATKNKVSKPDAEYIFELVDKFAGYGFNKSHAAAYARRQLSHGLPQGELPRGVLRRLDDARCRQHRQARHVHGRGEEVGHRHPAALRQRLRGRFPGRGAERRAATRRDPLFDGRAQEHRRAGGGEPGRRAHGQRRRSRTSPISRRGSTPRPSTSGRWRRSPPPARSMRLEGNRALVHGNVEPMMAFANRTASNAAQGIGDLFGGGWRAARPGAAMRHCGRSRRGRRWSGCSTSSRRSASSSRAIPLDAYTTVLAKLGIQSYSELEGRADRGAVAGRLAGIVVSARERRSQKGNKFAFAMFSEPTGQFEAVIFSETLAASRPLLEPGTAVLLTVEGERDGEALKMRVQSMQSLDEAANGLQKGLKVVLDGGAVAAGRLDELKAHAQARRQGHRLPQPGARRPRPRGRDRHARPLRHLARAEERDCHGAGRAWRWWIFETAEGVLPSWSDTEQSGFKLKIRF